MAAGILELSCFIYFSLHFIPLLSSRFFFFFFSAARRIISLRAPFPAVSVGELVACGRHNLTTATFVPADLKKTREIVKLGIELAVCFFASWLHVCFCHICSHFSLKLFSFFFFFFTFAK